MFYGLENTQSDVASLLEEPCKSDNFPCAVLFSGHPFSSRMYAAISVAKFFGSFEDSTVVLSDRNYDIRLRAALQLYRKSKNGSSAKLLKETLSIFIKQYHGALLDSASSTEKKKFSDAGDCAELLVQIGAVSENEVEQLCNKLEKSFSGLKLSKQSSISVSKIRAVRSWCSTSSTEGKKKFVIIEGLENSTPSASNALLKIIEEPPEDTFFILISDNSGRIPQTILSRVRKFNFKPLTDEEKKYIFNMLFIPPTQYADLKSFFIEYSGINDNLLSENAHNLIFNGKCDVPAVISELEKTQAWDRFFELVSENLKQRFFDDPRNSSKFAKAMEDISKVLYDGDVFNQTKRQTFEYVIYRIGELLQ